MIKPGEEEEVKEEEHKEEEEEVKRMKERGMRMVLLCCRDRGHMTTPCLLPPLVFRILHHHSTHLNSLTGRSQSWRAELLVHHSPVLLLIKKKEWWRGGKMTEEEGREVNAPLKFSSVGRVVFIRGRKSDEPATQH